MVLTATLGLAPLPIPPCHRRWLATASGCAVALLLAVLSSSAHGAAAPGQVDLLNERAYDDRLHELIAGASVSIEAMVYLVVLPADARPTQTVRRQLDAMIAARRRGVAVRVVLDAGSPPPAPGEPEQRPSLAAAEYLRAGGIEVRWDEDERMTHVKALAVDGRACVVGSGNWTVGGLRENRELAVCVESPAVAARFAELFAAAWAAGRAVEP